jgi:hypothetical protein
MHAQPFEKKMVALYIFLQHPIQPPRMNTAVYSFCFRVPDSARFAFRHLADATLESAQAFEIV